MRLSAYRRPEILSTFDSPTHLGAATVKDLIPLNHPRRCPRYVSLLPTCVYELEASRWLILLLVEHDMPNLTPPDSPVDRSVAGASKIAPALFRRPDADVIISSSDDVHFRVHRQILLIASPLFETMFSLPQPQSSATSLPESLPIINVEEDARTLEDLLRIIYPVRDPQLTINVLTDWQQFGNITRAALKYDIAQAIEFMKARLISAVDAFPMNVFCLACKHGLESIAKSAAARLAAGESGKLTSYVQLLEDIPAGPYHRLLQVLDHGLDEQRNFCQRGDHERDGTDKSTTSTPSPHHRIRDLRDVDSGQHAIQTADKAFYAISDDHFQMFSSPSDTDSDLLSDLESETVESRDGESSPALTLVEDSQTIDTLLRAETRDIDDLEKIALSLRAAEKYKAERARKTFASQWGKVAYESPLLSYLVAATHGLKDEMRSSAKLLLKWSTEKLRGAYDPAMEWISAGHYYRLLRYHEMCVQAASDSLQSSWEGAFPPALSRHCQLSESKAACTEGGQARWADRCFQHIQALEHPRHWGIQRDVDLIGESCFQAGNCRLCATHVSPTDIIAVLTAYAKANEASLNKVRHLEAELRSWKLICSALAGRYNGPVPNAWIVLPRTMTLNHSRHEGTT